MTATYTRREERTGTVTRVSGSSVTTGPGWDPPEVGVCADGWPTLTKVKDSIFTATYEPADEPRGES